MDQSDSDIHIHHSNNGDEIIRPLANFAPSLWVNLFSSMVVLDDQTIQRCSEEHDELKAEMRLRLTNGNTSMEEKLALVDILERLGISYLFKSEIEEELEKIFVSSFQIEMNEKQDLSIVSLYFRLLRQHGFPISPETFDGFKDNDGFKSILRTDTKGLLNLYEAAHTRINGEDILEEAFAFSSTHLTLMIPHLPPSLSKHCVHTLEHPFHKSVTCIEARFFISLYEEEEEESKNDLVLRLAKLDYSLLQILHRKEMAEISRWWKDLISKYPYAKDRSVEVYFWCIGVYFEPEYSLARVMLTKTICVATVIDDTYDAYGTLDEIKVFTEAVKRWDVSEINRLPEYMKHLYKALLQLYASFEEELQNLGMSYAVSHAKERIIELTQSYYTEAKWFIEGHTPSFEEYLENALLTSGYFMIVTTSLIGIESATKEEFEWLKTNPDILKASATICRIVNDICGYENDKKKGQNTTGIDSYMKQYGVTKEEAMKRLDKMVENAWKDLNKACLIKPKTASNESILNNGRLAGTYYTHKLDQKVDRLNYPDKGLMNHIIDMLVDTIEI